MVRFVRGQRRDRFGLLFLPESVRGQRRIARQATIAFVFVFWLVPYITLAGAADATASYELLQGYSCKKHSARLI